MLLNLRFIDRLWGACDRWGVGMTVPVPEANAEATDIIPRHDPNPTDIRSICIASFLNATSFVN
jgi:hypothetical protein